MTRSLAFDVLGLSFARPEGFWLAAAALGVLLAHVVRRRARRIVVPFLSLWAVAERERHGGRGTALVRHLDLACVLIACAAVAVAAGAPFRPGTPDTRRDLVLVLDGSVNARAADRMAALRAAAREEIVRRAAGSRVVLVSAGDGGASVESFSDVQAALAGLADFEPGWGAPSLAPALELARTAAGSLRDPDLCLCTSRDVPAAGFRLRAIGDPVRNFGLHGLEVLTDPEGGGEAARLLLVGKGAVEVVGHWKGEVDGRRTLTVPLPDDGPFEIRLNAEGDVFPHDDVLYLNLRRMPAPRPLVVYDGEVSPFLQAALDALERTGSIRGPLVRVTRQKVAPVARSYDLLIFDRCAPSENLPDVPALYLAPPPSPHLPFRVGSEQPAPTLFDVRGTHPLLRGVGLERIPPRRARSVEGGRTLARAASGSVLQVDRTWIALGFEPEASVFASSAAYPIFLRNAIEALARRAESRAPEFYVVGERVPAPGGGEAVLTGPPGRQRLGDQDVAVNLLMPDLDLAPPTRSSAPLPAVGEAGRPDRSYVVEFAALALALLVTAWWVYWRL